MTKDKRGFTDADLKSVEFPEISAEKLSQMRPAAEVRPDLVARYRGQRGPQKTPTKEVVTIRLDREILSHFRGTGEGWQTRVNTILAEYVAKGGEVRKRDAANTSKRAVLRKAKLSKVARRSGKAAARRA